MFDDVEIEELDPKYFDIKETDVSVDEDEDGDGTMNTRFKVIKTLPASTDVSVYVFFFQEYKCNCMKKLISWLINHSIN